MVTQPDPRKGPVDRIPPIGRLTVTHLPKRPFLDGVVGDIARGAYVDHEAGCR
ncbi:MAG: hypothetical protein JWN67_3363 [Actinomycetia bacterium]|nr:hypothetical protein [Actinomycetes bacterium]